MTISTIIERNNQTIAFFNESDYLNAIESSLTSLRETSEITDPESSEEESENESSGSSSDRLDQCMLLPAAASDIRRLLLHSDFIYDQAIPISQSLKVDKPILSAIVIFNAALAHHLAAESRDIPTPPKALFKAQRLYRLAYQAYTPGPGTQSILFQFAVINNLGVVERRLGNTALSNQYFDYLASLLEHL
ncbi:unnamed protein product [Cylindrotheca closterium]|uniref:Uncharacterized protein n=1 Tax=Cylindrotheca closterium TaxID=2856 RepID=A0AAD2GCG4_9STRA|nr:unnamed protein product [Cylindrotheca closterium]